MTHPTPHPAQQPNAARALIAEDEPLLALALAAELHRAWPHLQLLATARDGDEAIALTLQHQPDVLFLDIRMPGCSGLDAAQAIVEDWPDDTALPLIVFVTAYDQHALQAFERHAVDYLLKPVQPARLAACCARLQGLLHRQFGDPADDIAAPRQGPPLPSHPTDASSPASAGPTPGTPGELLLSQLRALLGTAVGGAGTAMAPHHLAGATAAPALQVIQAAMGNQVHLIPIDEVLYFEAADKYLRVVTATREHLIRLSLRELVPQLDAQRFWQVHRGTVVQIREVAQALRDESGKVTLTLRQRPDKLAVSRIYAPRFKGM
jgi:DNA-binding LytR/AlgR family response regulator